MANVFLSYHRKGPGTVKNKDAETQTHQEQVDAKKTGTPTLFEGSSGRHDTTVPGEFFDRDSIDVDEPGPEDFPNLGALLVYLRDTYPERLANGRALGARLNLPANAVADYIKQRGYSMSSGSYSLLEQGKTLPGDPIAFFSLLCECLAVKANSKFRPLLIAQYLYDVAVRSVGEMFAETSVPRGAAALAGVREQRQAAQARDKVEQARDNTIGQETAKRPATVI